MAAKKTAKPAAAADADRAALEAFYMRVMHRVCRSYRERSGNGDAAAKLEQKWTDHMACYTGGLGDLAVGEDEDLDLVEPSFAMLDRELDALLPVGLDSTVADLSVQVGSHRMDQALGANAAPSTVGQPFSLMPHDALPTPSVFAKMLGTKRPFNQVDGPAADDMASAELLHDMSDPRRRRLDEAPAPLSSHDAMSTLGTLEPTSELLPVSALSVSQFPLQLSAYYSKFGYRSKLQGYAGEVHAAILTMPAPIAQTESVAPGHLLWRPSSHAGGVDGMVEVIARDDKLQSVRVKTSNGGVDVVPIASAFRLKECVIPKGTVCFRE